MMREFSFTDGWKDGNRKALPAWISEVRDGHNAEVLGHVFDVSSPTPAGEMPPILAKFWIRYPRDGAGTVRMVAWVAGPDGLYSWFAGEAAGYGYHKINAIVKGLTLHPKEGAPIVISEGTGLAFRDDRRVAYL